MLLIIIDSIDKAILHLRRGYLLGKVEMKYSGMKKEHLVAGLLMGLSKEVWWYVILQEQGGGVHGLMNKEVFVKLYEQYYIEKTADTHNSENYYSLNTTCSIQEMPRYRHRIQSWEEAIQTPKTEGKAYFG
jgi:hypothetical protein